MSWFLSARRTRYNGLWQVLAPIDPRSARTNCGLLKCHQYALFPSDISDTTVSLDNSHGPASALVRPGVQAAGFYPSGRPHRMPGTSALLPSQMAVLSSKNEEHYAFVEQPGQALQKQTARRRRGEAQARASMFRHL